MRLALAITAWQTITRLSAGHAGYTHQWRRAVARGLRPYVMASVDSPEQMRAARRRGWRTFRVRTADEPLEAREFACPASDEGGNRRTCETCSACRGGENPGGAVATPAIIVHGSKRVPHKQRRFALMRKLMRQHKAYRNPPAAAF